jgi:hypothetical protein
MQMAKPKSEPWMREPKAKSIRPTATPRVLILFGYDEEKKPRAAKFYEPEFEAARKAAEMMKLQSHEADTKKVRRALGKIAIGNVYASGWAGIPHIRQNQYEALVKKLTGKEAAKAGAPTVAGYPANWDQIEVGSCVVAPADNPTQDGFWKSVVTSIEGDMLSLTLLDFPDEKGKRHRSTVALLDPTKNG